MISDVTKLFLQYGLLGLVCVLELAVIAKLADALVKLYREKEAQGERHNAELRAREEQHRKALDDLGQRLVIKAENYAAHQGELSEGLSKILRSMKNRIERSDRGES